MKQEEKRTKNKKKETKESNRRRREDWLSVYELFLRSGGRPAAAVIALSLTAEAAVILMLMRKETMYYENLFARGAIVPFVCGLALLTLVLADPLRAQKSNVDYTLRRLHITPLAVYRIETVYVLLAYFVFWALHLTLLYALGSYFTTQISTAANREMGMLLAFVRAPQLYMLLPIKNGFFLVRNVTGVLALSACIARYSYFARKGQTKLALAVITTILLANVDSGVTDNLTNGIVTALMLACGLLAAGSVKSEEQEAETEPAAASRNSLKKRQAERMVEDGSV